MQYYFQKIQLLTRRGHTQQKREKKCDEKISIINIKCIPGRQVPPIERSEIQNNSTATDVLRNVQDYLKNGCGTLEQLFFIPVRPFQMYQVPVQKIVIKFCKLCSIYFKQGKKLGNFA